MKYIALSVFFFCLGLLIGIYASEGIFRLFSEYPIVAITFGVIIAAGVAYLIFLVKNRIDKPKELGSRE
jgi:hypothetical protein